MSDSYAPWDSTVESNTDELLTIVSKPIDYTTNQIHSEQTPSEDSIKYGLTKPRRIIIKGKIISDEN